MERTQQILLHRILQTNLVCDLMIEDFVNVPAFQIVVSFIRRCGHTKPQLWFEIVQDFFVAVGGAVVGFINYDCIKCILLIPMQILIFAQCLNGCKDKILVIFLIFSRHQSHRNLSTEYLAE